MKRRSFIQLAAGAALVTGVAPLAYPARAASKSIVYLTPGLDLPFWRYLSKGVEVGGQSKRLRVPGAGFQQQPGDPASERPGLHRQGRGRHRDLPDRYLHRAQRAGTGENGPIPVVIADIGTNSGNYVSFIISDNYDGAQGTRRGTRRGPEGEGLGGRQRRHHLDLPGAEERTGPHQGLPRRTDRRRSQDQGSRPATDAVLYRRRDLPLHPGHADGEPGDARPLRSDRPACRRRPARHQGRPPRRRGAGRSVRRHTRVRALLQSGELVASGMQQPYLMGVTSGEAMMTTSPARRGEGDLRPDPRRHHDNIDKELPDVKETVFANEVN